MSRAEPAVPTVSYATRRGGAERARAARGLVRGWRSFKRLTELGFPRRFAIVQFPNAPLIVALIAGEAGRIAHGSGHTYGASLSYLAMTIWAYEELIRGVNWLRHLLDATYVLIMIMRVAHALT